MMNNDPIVASLREAALWLAAHGFHVFPLTPDSKRPAIKDWEHAATRHPGTIRHHWAHRPLNIGIACGPSRLVVIDLDTAKPGNHAPTEWQQPGIHDGSDVFATLSGQAQAAFPPDTFTVATPSGGTHFYHHTTEGLGLHNTASKIGWLVDTRANGGYVVAPGSIINGTRYRTINPTRPAPLPAWLSTALHTDENRPAKTRMPRLGSQVRPPLRPGPSALRQPTEAAYSYQALKAELQRVFDAPAGTRNDTLNTAAFSLGQLVAPGWLDHDTTTYLLTTAAAQIGLSEREAARTIASGLASGARHPRVIRRSA
jgi:hypothetical protein